MRYPQEGETAPGPAGPSHAALVEDLTAALELRSGLDRILCTADRGRFHTDSAHVRAAPAACEDDLQRDRHVALRSGLAAVLRLEEGVARILGIESAYLAVRDDLTASIDTTVGLAAIRNAAHAPAISVVPRDAAPVTEPASTIGDSTSVGRPVGRPLAAESRPAVRRQGRLAVVAGAVVAVVAAVVVGVTTTRWAGSPGENAGSADGGDRTSTHQAAPVGVGGQGSSPAPGLGRPGAGRGQVPVEPPMTSAPLLNGGVTGEGGPAWAETSASGWGSTVTVRCTGEVATIVTYQEADGWSVIRLNRGPADRVHIRFESASVSPYRLTFEGRCKDGTPRINADSSLSD